MSESKREKKVSKSLKWASPFSHPRIPSRELIQTLPRHGVGLSKAFCERLRKEKRFNLLYERAKEFDLLVIPNHEGTKNGKKLRMDEQLLYVVCRVNGEQGFLKLKEFVDEFSARAPTGAKQDSRNYVI